MYQYQYVYCELNRWLSDSTDHRSIIDEMASDGWRFVGLIPFESNANGVIKGGDLVFEREMKEE